MVSGPELNAVRHPHDKLAKLAAPKVYTTAVPSFGANPLESRTLGADIGHGETLVTRRKNWKMDIGRHS